MLATVHQRLILLGCVVACLSCGLCSEPGSDEEQIRSLIDRAVALAEKQDVDGLLELGTEDLSVMPNRLRGGELRRWMFFVYRRYREISLHFPRPLIELGPDGLSASTGITFLLLRKGEQAPDLEGLRDRPEDWLAKVGQGFHLFRLELTLVKQQDGWRFATALFKPLRGFSFQ